MQPLRTLPFRAIRSRSMEHRLEDVKAQELNKPKSEERSLLFEIDKHGVSKLADRQEFGSMERISETSLRKMLFTRLESSLGEPSIW